MIELAPCNPAAICPFASLVISLMGKTYPGDLFSRGGLENLFATAASGDWDELRKGGVRYECKMAAISLPNQD